MQVHGLTQREVEASRTAHGGNALSRGKRQGFWRQLLHSFGDPIIKILLAALAANVVFLFRHFDWYESAGIAAAIFLATFVSTLSERGSESAFEKLQEEAAKLRCRVRRAGQVLEVPVEDVVVGDIVLLQAGERVPADGVLIEGQLGVDQSALNGESREAEKRAGDGVFRGAPGERGELFRGSVVCAGEGVLRVCRVGDATFYGGVARELQEDTRESPLRVRLSGLAQTLSRLGYVAAGLVAAADLFHAFFIANGFRLADIAAAFDTPQRWLGHLLHAATLAITVVVVAVPEGLPMMITVVLSRNMRRMLKDQVMVRKLVGIETSGSMNILFTDKTGTLTQGRPQVSCLVGGGGDRYDAAALARASGLWELTALSCVHNSGSVASGRRAIGGNITDRALLEMALGVGSRAAEGYRVSGRVPFDSARKFSAARVEPCGGGGGLTLVKGAPERLLAACTRYYDAHGVARPLDTPALCRAALAEMTGRAMRVLVLAATEAPLSAVAGGQFSGLTLIGLAGIRDDVRPGVREAVRQVGRAGIQVVMITGDNRETAVAIARESGILAGGRGQEAGVVTSEELAGLSDAALAARLPSLRVVARALPADKSRLVRLAQERGLVVGMTGDGINDAPALKKADVGFAMGSGTEVAKEAGDVVILDDNFASIAKAVLYGRTIFKSIRKFIIFQLTMNFCAVGLSVIGPFIGIDTPVTVMQMLWINIIMDTLAGLAFAGEPPLREYMEEPPKRREERILNRYMLHQILCTGLFTVGICVGLLKLEWLRGLFRYGDSPVYLMTAFFSLFIFCGVFGSFNARTHRLNLMAHLHKNISFIIIMTLVCAVQMGMIYYGGSLFRTAGLTAAELARVLLLAALVIPADGARKLVLRAAGRKGTI